MNFTAIKNNYKQLAGSQKKGAGTPAYTRFVNRWLGRLFASILACFNTSPNIVSLVSGLITITSLLLFTIIEDITIIKSSLLVISLYFAYALDSSDGQLARLLNKQSKQGEWLDHTLDAIKIPLSHGVAIYLIYNNSIPNPGWIIFYLAILSFACANFLSGILKSKLKPNNSTNINMLSKHKTSIRSFLTLPLDYGVFILLFFFLFNNQLFFIIYSLWGVIFILYSLLLLIKSWREVVSYNAQ
jgi:phosphatidylglycerophosphate synthase